MLSTLPQNPSIEQLYEVAAYLRNGLERIAAADRASIEEMEHRGIILSAEQYNDFYAIDLSYRCAEKIAKALVDFTA